MRHQSQVGNRHGIAEGGQRSGQRQVAGDGLSSRVGQPVAINHHVPSVLGQFCMDMQAAAGVTDHDFRGKGDRDTVPIADHPQHPFRDGHLVGRVFHGHGLELDLVLLHLPLPLADIADLRVAILNLAAGLGDSVQDLASQLLPFGERRRFMVALLSHRRIQILLFRENVVLQLSHGLEAQSRAGLQ